MISTLNISKESKVWIYQSPIAFNVSQLALINNELTKFIATWESHGVALQGGYDIISNQFILLAVDENTKNATGCSIDKSVSIIKKIETLLSINLTDKGLIAYEVDGNIKTVVFRDIKTKISSGEIEENTTIFNLSISTFSELETNWRIHANQSWLKKYFNA